MVWDCTEEWEDRMPVMRSLNDISAELSDYPKEMLVQMAQGGNSGYPEISILMVI